MKSVINFIGIGAQRSGTSWLYDQFEKSYQVDVLPLKELHYFDRESKYSSPDKLKVEKLFLRIFNIKWLLNAILLIYRKRKDFKWYKKFLFSNYNDKWYLSLFKYTKKCTGEITPSYSILDETDIIKMKNLLGPQTKIIFIIRNPIDRAWSSYRYIQRGKYLKSLNIKHAKNYFNSDKQKLRSDYVRTLENYLKHFDSVCVCFFDAIVDQPDQLLKEIFDYLNLDSTEIKKLSKVDKNVNRSKTLKMPSELKYYLKEMYEDDLIKMSNYFGNYTNTWVDNSGNKPDNFKPTLIFE